MMNLYEALTEILTDPDRKSLYSGSQLVALVRERGVQLPADRGEAWELVTDAREEIELQLYRNRALKTAIQSVRRGTDKQLSHNDLLIILVAACENLPADQASALLALPDDYDEALALVARLCDELAQESEASL